MCIIGATASTGSNKPKNMISKGIIPQQPREEAAPTAASPDVG